MYTYIILSRDCGPRNHPHHGWPSVRMWLNNYSTCDSIAFEHWMISKVIHYVDRVHHFTVTIWTFILCNYGCVCMVLVCLYSVLITRRMFGVVWLLVFSCFMFISCSRFFLVSVYHLVDTVFILFRLLLLLHVCILVIWLIVDRFFFLREFLCAAIGEATTYCIRALIHSLLTLLFDTVTARHF